MHCAFKSFEGNNTQVQAVMAEDINANDGSEAFPLEKLATKHSQFVAILTSARAGIGLMRWVVDGTWLLGAMMLHTVHGPTVPVTVAMRTDRAHGFVHGQVGYARICPS